MLVEETRWTRITRPVIEVAVTGRTGSPNYVVISLKVLDMNVDAKGIGIIARYKVGQNSLKISSRAHVALYLPDGNMSDASVYLWGRTPQTSHAVTGALSLRDVKCFVSLLREFVADSGGTITVRGMSQDIFDSVIPIEHMIMERLLKEEEKK